MGAGDGRDGRRMMLVGRDVGLALGASVCLSADTAAREFGSGSGGERGFPPTA